MVTPAELEKARDLVEDMEECAASGLYFEIDAQNSRLLADYIRELERSVTRHTPAK